MLPCYLGGDAALINHPPILLSNNVVEGLAEGLKVLLLGRTHTTLGLLELWWAGPWVGG